MKLITRLSFFALFIVVVIPSALADDYILPDHSRTPGATYERVTQENIHTNICVAHWTESVRPPASYTTALKRQQLNEWGYQDKNLSDYEEDHLISLELGGDPKDIKNLWPEAYIGVWGARKKDVVERKLNRLVCQGQLSLKEAQEAIARNWIDAYHKYVDANN